MVVLFAFSAMFSGCRDVGWGQDLLFDLDVCDTPVHRRFFLMAKFNVVELEFFQVLFGEPVSLVSPLCCRRGVGDEFAIETDL